MMKSFPLPLIAYFRKRRTPAVMGGSNETILRGARAQQANAAKSKDDDGSNNHSGDGGNSGTMIVDATRTPSIRYS